ncbi:CPBP family intramembrane metalloprotease [candidate division WOR-3 bacterium]|nr:CPBP family intramembrane metalloprotease [candidate division WOR-3 bacterium]
MKLLKNPVMRIVFAILLGLLILLINHFVKEIITIIKPDLMKSKIWLSPSIGHLSMLVFSILTMLIVSKRKLSHYGFNAGNNIRYFRTIFISFILGIITMIFVGVAVSLLNSFFPVTGVGHFASEYSFLEQVIFIWILASISEEVLTRGLIQGYLEPLVKYRKKLFKITISLPILIGALFFAAMHIGLLTTGMNIYMFSGIVFSTFILGVVAGYFREKTNSLIPAIIAHMMFNIGGGLLSFIGKLKG